MAKQVIEIVDDSNDKREYGLSYNSVVTEDPSKMKVINETSVSTTKRRGRPPKSETALMSTDGIIPAQENSKKTNKDPNSDFEKGYLNTSRLLYGAIAQSDMIYNNIETELNNFRTKPSYGGRNRMGSMTDLMNTQATLINTKISAIRELNSSRNKINDLILKRQQMLKDQQDQNSDKTVMDAYYAMINAPRYGLPTFHQQLSPMSINTGINLAGSTIPTNSLGADTDIVPANNFSNIKSEDKSFNDYANNLTPVQRKMILENDPSVKTVVVYDQSSGNRWFDVINIKTGQAIPGVEKPADFLLDNMRIDASNGIAVNSDANVSFPLVIIGMSVSDEL